VTNLSKRDLGRIDAAVLRSERRPRNDTYRGPRETPLRHVTAATHAIEVTSATPDSLGYPAQILFFNGSSWTPEIEVRAVRIGGGTLGVGHYPPGRLMYVGEHGGNQYGVYGVHPGNGSVLVKALEFDADESMWSAHTVSDDLSPGLTIWLVSLYGTTDEFSFDAGTIYDAVALSIEAHHPVYGSVDNARLNGSLQGRGGYVSAGAQTIVGPKTFIDNLRVTPHPDLANPEGLVSISASGQIELLSRMMFVDYVPQLKLRSWTSPANDGFAEVLFDDGPGRGGCFLTHHLSCHDDGVSSSYAFEYSVADGFAVFTLSSGSKFAIGADIGPTGTDPVGNEFVGGIIKTIGGGTAPYTPSNSADWAGDPTDLKNAVDRLAAALAAGATGVPVP
jgi:hypothetical protein